MTSHLFQRRRAERYAQLLTGAGRHARSGYDQELAPLVPAAERLTGLGVALTAGTAADPDFTAALRANLMARIAREGIGETAVTAAPRQVRRRRTLAPRGARARAVLVIGVTTGTLALGGMSAASGDAMPGDPLYGMKRSTERAQLALAGSDVNRGQLYLGFARNRLAEGRAVRSDQVALRDVLGDMDADTLEGVRLLTNAAAERRDPAALDAVEGFVTQQRREVVDLLTGLAGGPRDRALTSLGLLDAVQLRSTGLRTTLACTASTGNGSDRLGPLPRRCTAMPAPGSRGGTSVPGPEAGKASRDTRTTHAAPAPNAPTGPAANAPAAGGGAAAAPTSGAPGGPGIPGAPAGSAPSTGSDQGGSLVTDLGTVLGHLLG